MMKGLLIGFLFRVQFGGQFVSSWEALGSIEYVVWSN